MKPTTDQNSNNRPASPESMRNKVNQLIEEGSLNQAMEILKSNETVRMSPSLMSRLSTDRETYKYMVKFFLDGVPDKDREKVSAQIAEGLRTIADGAVRESRVQESPDLYSSTLRMNRHKPATISSLIEQYKATSIERELAEVAEADISEIQKRLEFLSEDLFNYVLTVFDSESEAKTIVEAVADDANPYELKLLILSALNLSLIHYYSRTSFLALIDIYDRMEEEDAIASRALTGMVITEALYPERVREDQDIIRRLSLWEDSISTYMKLRETIRAIVGTRDTERVSAKMKDEVIPELMKLQPDFIQKLRDASQDSESMMLDDNPEWEELLNKSGLAKKMEELQSMQKDGADMMMVAFSSLKQFPFFNKAVNWFRPFDVRTAGLIPGKEEARIMETLSNLGGQICDSDKYSLALALRQMPETQRNMVVSNFSSQLEILAQENKDKEFKTSVPGFNAELMKYTKDLYRFFKLFRNKTFLTDPFKLTFNFRALPVVGEMMANDEVLRIIGEFYFSRGFYKEALPLLESLSDEDPSSAPLWEKIGFARQSLMDYSGARDAYEKAELLKTPGQWLVRKLAFVNKRLGDHRKAVHYYEQALEAEPDNVELLLAKGHSQLEIGEPQEALKAYYHANYILKDDIRTLRSIAWAELLKGNSKKSLEYYDRILAENPIDADFLNAGHANAAAGNFRTAVEMYRKASSGNLEEFKLAYMADMATLLKLGVTPLQANLMMDAIEMED